MSIITHHLRSFLGPFNMHSYAKSDILILILRRLYCTSRKFDLLASSQKCNSFFTWNNTTKLQNNFHSSSFPLLHLWKRLHNCTISKPLLLAESAYFHHFPYDISTLTYLWSPPHNHHHHDLGARELVTFSPLAKLLRGPQAPVSSVFSSLPLQRISS